MSVKDRWDGAKSGPGNRRWEVRYREAGRQRRRWFSSKKAAVEFDAQLKLDPVTAAAEEGRDLTVSQMMGTWLATKRQLRPKTQQACAMDAKEITDTFGGRRATSVRPSEVKVWVARDRGSSIRRRSLVAFKAAYALAMADGLLRDNPAAGAEPPRVESREPRFLTWQALASLAEHSDRDGPLVWTLGTCGLRIGEAVALTVGDVDVARGRLRVKHSKTGRARDVPIAPFVADMLDLDRSPSEPLFTNALGHAVEAHTWRQKFQRAAKRAGLGHLYPHLLRHTAASLAIGMGADVKAIQRMLGHASATMTLDRYGHLFDAHLDEVSAAMNSTFVSHKVVRDTEMSHPGLHLQPADSTFQNGSDGAKALVRDAIGP